MPFPLLLCAFAGAADTDAVAEAVAADLDVAAAPPAAPAGWDTVLLAADDLADRKEYASARDVFGWVAHSPHAPLEVRDRAAARLHELPRTAEDWEPTARLIAWHGALGAWLGGPNIASLERVDVDGGFVLGGAVGGGAIAVAGTAVYARHVPLTYARTHAIVGAEQLLGFHGATLGLAIDDSGDKLPAGLLVGSLAGAVAGHGLATLPLDDGKLAAAHAGMFWGAGAGVLGLATFYRTDGTPIEVLTPVLVTTDAGVVGGYLLATALDLSRQQVRMINLGGAAGGLVSLGFVFASEEAILWTPGAVAATVAVGALGGGAVGLLVAEDVGAPRVAVGSLVTGTDDDLRLGVPVPVVLPDRGAAKVEVSLASVRF